MQETVDIPSAAEPADTPGSPGVVVTNPKLLTQFGGASFSLNNARYTRYRLAGPAQQPDAILILVPGFEGGASNFKILAENLIPRAHARRARSLEVWAFDRRTNQLEDRAGLDIAEEFLDPQIALDWLFGGELGLTLHPAARRRARTAAPSSTTRRPTSRSSPTGRTSSSRATSTRSSTRRAPRRATRTSSSAATRPAPASPRATPRPTST